MKKLPIVLAVIALLAGCYFAFIQYTIFALIAIISIVIFWKEATKKKNIIYTILATLSALVVIIGVIRTFFGLG